MSKCFLFYDNLIISKVFPILFSWNVLRASMYCVYSVVLSDIYKKLLIVKVHLSFTIFLLWCLEFESSEFLLYNENIISFVPTNTEKIWRVKSYYPINRITISTNFYYIFCAYTTSTRNNSPASECMYVYSPLVLLGFPI